MDLLHRMLADWCMQQHREGGTMAAIWQRQPPWLGCVFLPSFRLANCVSEVPQPPKPPKNHPLSNLISPSIMVGWGCLNYPFFAHARLEDACAIWTNDSFILGLVEPGEASETMVCGPSIVLLHKLVIYCDYTSVILVLVYIQLKLVPELQKREKS
jgi:hypothetical protein